MGNARTSNRWLKVAGGVGAALGIKEALAQAREADLTGKVALITGGSSGHGFVLASELAREGCRLVICARDELELQRAGKDLEERGAEVLVVRCDVADKDDVDRMIQATIDAFGSIDLLVCNAGVIQVGQLSSMELHDFESSMDIMFWGVLYPILAALPHMREQGEGQIAIVASIGGKVSVPYLLPYNTAKFAAVGLGEGLRAELADEGITVTTLVPGLMRTGSYLNAEFSGEEEARGSTYRMFSSLSSIPLLTASAESVAKAFVKAIKRGEIERIYPPQYDLVARMHGLMPSTTVRAMSLADRMLPKTGDSKETVPGARIDDQIPQKGMWRTLTRLGRRASERLQH